jgi:Uncharacterised protein family (UPF0149)
MHLIQHQPDDYEPLFWETPDGEAVAGDWAEGFMAGVALRRSSWQPLLESEEGGGLLAPIVAFLHDEEGNSLIEGEADPARRDPEGRHRPCRTGRTSDQQLLEGPSASTTTGIEDRSKRALPVWIRSQVQALLWSQLGSGFQPP